MSTKIALWGFGHMNKVILQYATEQGYQVVSVIGRHDIGKDAGEVAGLANLGVQIVHEDSADAELQKTKPLVAIVATRSLLKDLVQSLKVLASNRINVVTISEEAFYSWNTSPEITSEIDQIFRKNSVSFTATGAQDAFWGFLPALMLGVTHKVDRIVGNVQYNVDDYGAALCELHGVGLTQEEFAVKFNPVGADPAYVWNSNEWLAARMKWKIIQTSQVFKPITAARDINSKSLGGEIVTGKVNGLRAVVTTVAEDRNGKIIEIETTQVGTVYYDDMADFCSWSIQGVPNLEIEAKKPDTVGITCASAVNRIKSIIDARSGYVPSCDLSPMQ